MTSLPSTSLVVGTHSNKHIRFDDECVVIPEPIPHSRLPHLITKSYSLPLWKKRGSALGSLSDSELDSYEEEHVVLKVSVPSFRTRTVSPDRCESQPLSPCIVSHSPSPKKVVRRPSLVLSPRVDAVTVPLRPCCPDCIAILEKCKKDGEEWTEKFTRGATRRRNSSVDSPFRLHVHHRVCEATPGFDSVVSVDEVDKKHKCSLTRMMEAARDNANVDTSFLSGPPHMPPSSSLGANPSFTPIQEDERIAAHPSLSMGITSSTIPLISNVSHSTSDSDQHPNNIDAVTVHFPPAGGDNATQSGVLAIPYYSPHSEDPTGRPSTSYFSPRPSSHVASHTGDCSSHIYHIQHDILSSPTKRRLLAHFPTIPGPASILRASAGVLKGVNIMSGSVAFPS